MDETRKIIEQYVEAAIINGEESLKDSKKANSAYKTIDKCFRILKETTIGLEQLSNLLLHDNDYVKLWAASHTLNYKCELAEKVLTELASKRGSPTAFDARMTLEEWKKGNLKF